MNDVTPVPSGSDLHSFSLELFEKQLGAQTIGKRVHYYRTVGSTNDVANQNLAALGRARGEGVTFGVATVGEGAGTPAGLLYLPECVSCATMTGLCPDPMLSAATVRIIFIISAKTCLLPL